MTRHLLPALAILAFAGALRAADTAPAPAAAEVAKPYPLTTCIVSGEKLGEMGDAVVLVYQGQEFKFCCKGCVKDFNKDPATFVKKLADAQAKAAPAAAPAPAPAADHH